MSKSLVLFSGGPDSTAVLLWALRNDLDPELLTFRFFDNWQNGELKSAMNIANEMDITHTIVDLKGIYN
ncbi:7-cyano-7-deazaguanine synthase [Arenibacter sp. F26102]|uniref:7-cyano-7-deazaguanine synthase n=1 Tax=Arenibacter sp. F26102 TaxID=2926416 RepID=UPI00248D0BCD|nr:7-cyano-7-deazaguanine synthase [Arenibacter sp. F26102]